MPDWPEVVRQYGALVWKTVYRLVGNQADASDCFQDTFLRAMQVSRRTEVCNWAGLLQRIAVQSALDRLRQRVRNRNRLTEGANCDALSSGGLDPAQHAVDSELADRLRRVLAELPESQATVFALRQLHDMSYEEIGRLTGNDVSHVGVLLHRTRRRLAEMLNSDHEPERGCTHAHRD